MTTLVRSLGLWTLIFYSIGDVLGAGIYVLVGRVIGAAGTSAWVSFSVAAALAAITGLTYAELSSRVPRAGGAAAYAAAAFRSKAVPFVVGVFVLASGVTSAAAVSVAVHGYLQAFIPVPPLWAASALLVLLAFVCFWGIRESAGTNTAFTIVEIAGLGLVILAGLSVAWRRPASDLIASLAPTAGSGVILAGAALAFFAFVGFEDLANLAEEARNPTRDIPRAMLAAVGVSTVLYLAVLCMVLWTQAPEEAAASATPLLDVFKKSGFQFPLWGFSAIALFAVANTGLANFVMASRLLYGMADQGLFPRALAAVHPARHTPWIATVTVLGLTLLLVFTGGVTPLAQTTSLLLTLVFAVLHAALIRLRRSAAAPQAFRVPAFVPYIGIALCGILAVRASPAAWGRAGVVAAVAAGLYALSRSTGLRKSRAGTNAK